MRIDVFVNNIVDNCNPSELQELIDAAKKKIQELNNIVLSEEEIISVKNKKLFEAVKSLNGRTKYPLLVCKHRIDLEMAKS